MRETKYHHGDATLGDGAIRMAQSFVGSNHLPLLMSIGPFGSRLANGADAAQPRYIATKLNTVWRLLFPRQDLSLLDITTERVQK
jgi:DNA topoisomerase-2